MASSCCARPSRLTRLSLACSTCWLLTAWPRATALRYSLRSHLEAGTCPYMQPAATLPSSCAGTRFLRRRIPC